MLGQLAFLFLLATTSQEAEFRNDALGMAFSYPATWSSEKTATGTKLAMVLGEDRKAILEIFDVDFRAAAEVWQNVEKASADQHRRTVERQWQEEVLGVPMLLTKANGTVEGREETVLSGLLYTASPRKLRFIITSTPAASDSAESAWRNCLVSLRTLDGKLPNSETPDRAPEIIPTVKPPTMIGKRKPATKSGFSKGTVEIPIEMGGGQYTLYLPEGWEASKEGDGVALKHPDLGGPVTLQVWTVTDDTPPGRALIQASASTLKEFAKVSMREDKGPIASGSGATVAWTKRTGESGSGPLVTFEFVGMSGKVAWLSTFRSTDAKAYQAVAGKLNALVQSMVIEPRL